jgi:hypothetical protein
MGMFVSAAFIALTLCPLRPEVIGSAASQEMVPLVVNEALARVPTDDPMTMDVIEGDANGDGVREASADEFVELVNVGMEPLDLSNFEVNDDDSPMGFIFPMETVVPPGEAVVLFGGGDLTMSRLEFGNSRALGLVFTTDGTIGTGLSNTADTVIVRDPMGREVLRFDYDSMNPAPQPVFQSLNRNPELTGPFANHRDVEGAGERAFSPGTRVDGRAFRRLIGELTPNAGPLAGGNQVTINGAGFGSEIASVWFGAEAATEVMRVNSLQVVVRAPAGAMAGPVTVKVIDQFGEIVSTDAYTYQTAP